MESIDEIEKTNNYAHLAEIKELGYNWNDNFADGFSDGLISKIQTCIDNLILQPSIFPTACNSIQLEYEKKNGDYLEFEISELEVNCLYIRNSNPKEYTFSFDITKMNKIIKEFYG